MDTNTEFGGRSSLPRQYGMLDGQVQRDEYQKFMAQGHNFQEISGQDTAQYMAGNQMPRQVTHYQSPQVGHYSSANSYQSESSFHIGDTLRSRAALSSTQPSSISSPNEQSNRNGVQSNADTPAAPFKDPTVFVAPHVLRQPEQNPTNLA